MTYAWKNKLSPGKKNTPGKWNDAWKVLFIIQYRVTYNSE